LVKDNKKTKVCAKCNEEKPFDEFYKKVPLQEKSYFQFTDFSSYCKECTIKVTKEAKSARGDYSGYTPTDVRKAQLFAFWQSIPSMVKGNKYIQEAKQQAVKGLEGEESVVQELVNASTYKEVSSILDVSMSTLKKYRESNYVQEYSDKFNRWSNVMRFKADVDHAFTKATIKHADAARYKLWYQIHMGWVPEEKKTHDMNESSMKQIQDELRKIGENNKDILEVDEDEYEEGEIEEDKMLESNE
jgi:hypothetical protein